jgi:tRNA-specific 2-thiouridylase
MEKTKILKSNKKHQVLRGRVAVAMSGGVDSSTVAKMLKDRGYDCLGVFMRLGIERGCCDEDAARKVCQKIGIKFYPIDVRAKFKKEVKDYFLSSYKKGITPNPCVKCNQLIKFGELLKRARALDCDYLATGHYIKIKKVKDKYKLFKAKDSAKDQTYFLYNLTQEELKHLMFPIGDSIKEKVKKNAKKDELPHLKHESQDVCFLSGEHNEYLRTNLKMKTGPIKTLDEKVLGEHKGLPLYTIGQRKGVEVGGTGPYYVVKKDFKTNTLFVTNKSDDPALSSKELVAENISWVSGVAPKFPLKCQAVIRYRHQAVPCVVRPLALIKKGSFVKVSFSVPQRAITSGQSVVFYKGNELLGGGVIQ